MALKEWVFPNQKRKKILKLSKEWGIPYVIVAVFSSRGIEDVNEINKFLNGEETILNPLMFEGMQELVKRINSAIDNFDRIYIYGDYDADGITSTVLLYLYLSQRGANVMYHIPSRYVEGYGLNSDLLKEIKAYGVKLIITVDNGISANAEVLEAAKLGMDVIVIDHHTPGEIPNAVAVVDPHRDLNLEFRDYAAVGVVFKAVEALEYNITSRAELIEKYGDLVAIGTIGDVVPLLGENRRFAIDGINVMLRTKRFGTRVLVESCDNSSTKFDSLNVVYNVVPKVNSCGRTGNPEMAAKLFLSETEEDSIVINEFLDQKNTSRKETCRHVFEEVEKMIEENPKMRFQPMIFAQSTDWNCGVLGIVASKIMVKYGKPTILFSIDNENVRGSARSIPGFSIFEAIENCSSWLERFGGHPMASGMNLKYENLEKFKNSLLEYAKKDKIPFLCLNINCILNINEINIENLENISRLRPFGAGNQEPIFAILGVKLLNIYGVSNDKHIKLSFSKENEIFYAMYFGVAKRDFCYSVGDILDLAIYLKPNNYLGIKNVTVSIKDIKYSSQDTHEMIRQKRIFENFMADVPQDKRNLIEMLPSRDDIIVTYKILKKNVFRLVNIDVLFNKVQEFDICLSKLYIIIEILNDLDIIKAISDVDRYNISVSKVSIKIDLDTSRYLLKIKNNLK
ncbi:MAG: single-stranded-DNA-specific exonuclease RecJ [Candidatus Improbicoccus devescovinae]|nr:MAG: single-stranded-DNA-specific exonuclease RecJ [Candidatus Improbicoccus devescovinae]